MDDEQQLLTTTFVASMLGVKELSVTRRAKAGKLPYLRLGGPRGCLRFRKSDVLAYIKSLEVQAKSDTPVESK
jgi:excisionase family DNA binding protein